ncbi:hypothetical protein CsSME_00048879 [Camellia sinensis var. sinensis]
MILLSLRILLHNMVTLSTPIRGVFSIRLKQLINVSAKILLKKLLMRWKMRRQSLMMNGVQQPLRN